LVGLMVMIPQSAVLRNFGFSSRTLPVLLSILL
jgi:hypothetical protein